MINKISTVLKLTALAISASASYAHAQDLSTEITVDRIVEPSQRQALRPALMPNLLSPHLNNNYPAAAECLQKGEITPMLARLSAASWEDSIKRSPYRGYIGAGYLPSLNFGFNGGYRFIDTPKAWLSAAAKYRGIDYSRDGYELNHQQALLMAKGGYRPNCFSILTVGINYRYDKVQEPFFNATDKIDRFYFTQNTHDFSINATWLSQPGSFSYDLSAGFSSFRFTEASPAILAMELSPFSQTSVNFKLGLGLADRRFENSIAIANPRRLGIDIDAAALLTNNGVNTLGLYHFKPYVRFGRDAFSGKAGLNLSVSSGQGSAVQVSPILTLAYGSADRPFAASFSLTGGKEFNTFSSLFAIDPYLSPMASYGFSRVLMDLEASFVYGPVAGFEIEAFAGFALPRDWLMPVISDRNAFAGTLFANVNAESSRLGARMQYSYKSYFSIGASAQLAHSEDGLLTWYQWRDSPKYVFSAWIGANPISDLDVKVSYDLRRSRSLLFTPAAGEESESGRLSLGDASCVSAKASYQITPQLSAFALVEIHNKHLLISTLPAPTLTGLCGISFKF